MRRKPNGCELEMVELRVGGRASLELVLLYFCVMFGRITETVAN